VALCAELGHDLVEADLPGLDDRVGAAIGTVFNAATAWIVGYWVRHRGREPEPDELDPLTRAYWDVGRGVSAADYLLAVGDLQKFARGVAGFLGGVEHGGVDLWLTPTMSAPPARIGEIASTRRNPCGRWRTVHRRWPIRWSSRTSPAVRRCRCRSAALRTGCRWACTSWAASAT
jgi:amidase